LEGGPHVPTRQILRAARSGAFLRGQLIHAWFERVAWLDEGRPAEAALRQVAHELLAVADSTGLDIAEQLRRFFVMLQTPTIAELLSRTHYQDLSQLGFPRAVQEGLGPAPVTPSVQAERGFAVRDGDQLLTGFLDRLVLLQRGSRVVAADILDYKTDAMAAGKPGQLADKVAFYSPQMQAYRRAVAKLTQLPLECILARLVFVEVGIVETVA